MRRLMLLGLGLSLLALAEPVSFLREVETLYPERYQLPVLERIISLYEQALASDPQNPELFVKLAQHWYEWAVLMPEPEEDLGWRKAADYAFRALGLSGRDEARKLSNEGFQ